MRLTNEFKNIGIAGLIVLFGLEITYFRQRSEEQ